MKIKKYTAKYTILKNAYIKKTIKDKNKILNDIDKTFKNIKQIENTCNALDFIDEIINALKNKYKYN